ncbi:MAG: GNAT family protein [Cyanobacteria bacterium P01_H01_bin.58]
MVTARVHLRPTTNADLPFVLTAENAPENASYINQWSHERHRQACEHPNECHWIVEYGAPLTSVGYVILLGLQDPHQCLLLKRIVITHKGLGLGKATLLQVIQKAFVDFDAHRLWLDVIEDNVRARSLYRSVGFVEEGCIREGFKRPDGFASMYLMGMLRSEFLEQQAQGNFL